MTRTVLFSILWCLASVSTMLLISSCGGSDDENPQEDVTQEQPGTSLDDKIDGLPEVDKELEAKIASLITQLNDPNTEIRRTAVLSLARINHPATVPGLMKALNDKDNEIRGIAVDALAKIGSPALEALIRELKRIGLQGGDEKPLFEVFGKIGTPAVQPLIDVWKETNQDYDVRLSANDALRAMGESAMAGLIKALKEDKDAEGRRVAAKMLGRIGKPAKDAVPSLKEASLNDEDEKVRESAAKAVKEIQAVKLINSNPPQGGEIGADGVLTLTFDEPPGNVTVNGRPATVQGTTATWNAVGLFPGQRVPLVIEWEGDNKAVITLNVKKVELLRSVPASGGVILENGTLKLFFNDVPKNVTVNGTPAVVQGKVATWQVVGVIPGFRPFQVAWDGGSARIPLFVQRADKQPPAIAGASVIDGDKDVDPARLNQDGIIIKFSEAIQKGEGTIDITLDDGTRLGWLVEWGVNWVKLRPPKGKELKQETLYTLIIQGVKDGAGNTMKDVKWMFVTKGPF